MKRSKHSLSHYKLFSCNQGDLVPIGLTEVLPGDTFQHSTSAFIRVSPLVTPVMHPVHAKIHHFFIPHRLVWNKSMDGDGNGWEDFITGGPDGEDASVFPTITAGGGGFAVGSLADYLGCPTGVAGLEVSALPFRAYALVCNEYYRDQDLVTELAVDTDEGPDATTNTTLFAGAWEKDYFTSARPWEQKGPSVSIPLSGNADVQLKTGTTNAALIRYAGTGGLAATHVLYSDPGGTTGPGELGSNTYATGPMNIDPNDTMEADLSNVTAVDMNDLRVAMALQRYEEARARWGSRYVEYLRYLGVKSSDARLQRPEYLGGGKQTIQFSEVLSTANTGGNVVGDMKGHGIGVMKSNRYRRFFEEHGYVLSLMIVRPVGMYMQGLPRTWNRRTKEDFWQMELQHVGQQAILNKELYSAHAQPDGVFGYQDRYDEYRRTESSVAGEMRTLLKSWHMAREFGSDPALNASFVTANPTDRIYASSATDQLIVMARHSIQARRKVAKVGTSYIF